jgi:hypothetical protein
MQVSARAATTEAEASMPADKAEILASKSSSRSDDSSGSSPLMSSLVTAYSSAPSPLMSSSVTTHSSGTGSLVSSPVTNPIRLGRAHTCPLAFNQVRHIIWP